MKAHADEAGWGPESEPGADPARAVHRMRNNGADLLDWTGLDWTDDPAAPPPSDAPAGPNPV